MAYDQNQLDNINTVLGVGKAKGASERALLVAAIIGDGENGWSSYGCNSSDHCGLFQLDSDWQAKHSYLDNEYWAAYAYDSGFYGYGGILQIVRDHPDWTPGEQAEACQGAGPTFAAASDYYEGHRANAQFIVNTYGPNAKVGGPVPTSGPSSPPSAPGVPTVIPITKPLTDFAYIIDNLNFAGDVDNLGKYIFERGNDARNNSRATRQHVLDVRTIGWT